MHRHKHPPLCPPSVYGKLPYTLTRLYLNLHTQISFISFPAPIFSYREINRLTASKPVFPGVAYTTEGNGLSLGSVQRRLIHISLYQQLD